MDNPRRTAVLALVKQEKSGYANLVLSQVLQNFTGTPRERAFVSAVFYGTIERQITLDTLLQPMLTKPLAKLDAERFNLLEICPRVFDVIINDVLEVHCS